MPHKLKRKFKVGDRYTFTMSRWHKQSPFVVMRVSDTGVDFHDLSESNSALSIPRTHCFSWPPLEHYLENGNLVKVKNEKK